MKLEDWPRPARRALAWGLISGSLAVALLPAAVLFLGARAGVGEPLTWSRILAGYSLVITVPVTIFLTALVAREINRARPKNLGLTVVMGTLVGVGAGLVLGIVTGGYALLSAPMVGLLTSLAVWALQPQPAPDAAELETTL